MPVRVYQPLLQSRKIMNPVVKTALDRIKYDHGFRSQKVRALTLVESNSWVRVRRTTTGRLKPPSTVRKFGRGVILRERCSACARLFI